ncbi:MAG: hypothetical protein ACLRZH_18000 [Ruthenibacterium lactatiformans]
MWSAAANAHRPHRRAGTGRHCAAAPGSQVCADAVVADGTLEVNEALLTGEAELVQKRPGDTLLSGSFVVTGACAARLDKVGTDCYAARITGEARRRKRHRSEMMRALDRLLRFISIAIIPVFVIMFAKQYFFLHTGLEYAMRFHRGRHHRHDPRGLYLLVSVALAVSVISLARSKTLVHELSCIENLARVDTLCLDKTGTITEAAWKCWKPSPYRAWRAAHWQTLGKAAPPPRARTTPRRRLCGHASALWAAAGSQSRRPLQLRAQVGCSGAERRRRIHPRRTGDRAGRRVCRLPGYGRAAAGGRTARAGAGARTRRAGGRYAAARSSGAGLCGAFG